MKHNIVKTNVNQAGEILLMHKKSVISLNNAKINGEYIVVKVENKNNLTLKRLMELGIVKNTVIKPIHKSPFGNPIAYLIRGTVIAIRNEDSQNITVRKK